MLNAARNAETSKKLNDPSGSKSAIGSINENALRNAETSKKLRFPSPDKSAGHAGGQSVEPGPFQMPPTMSQIELHTLLGCWNETSANT